MKKPEVGDYIICEKDYFRIVWRLESEHRFAVKNVHTGATRTMVSFRGGWRVETFMDSYAVKDIIDNVEFMLRKLNGEFTTRPHNQHASGTGKR